MKKKRCLSMGLTVLSILSILMLTLLTVRMRGNVSAASPLPKTVASSGASAINYDQLHGIASVSATDIWVVGSYYNSNGQEQPLIEHWNGSSLNVVPNPNPGQNAWLNSVVAVSATDAWAVGSFSTSYTQTLIEHWNGTSWKVVPSPNPGQNTNELFSVAAASATDVWAVGSFSTSYAQTLIEHWNGTSWKVVPSPNPGSSGDQLASVAAVSATHVWAVGSYEDANYKEYTLIEQWNGTSWKVAPSPNLGQYGNELRSVAAVSATDVWAVGHYITDANGQDQPLIEQWNGTSWKVAPSPNPGQSTNELYSVVAVSATDVWAVGSSDTSYAQTLIEQWNGTSWKVIPSPSPGKYQDFLEGATAVSATDVWAVGFYVASYVQPLIEQWNGTSWKVGPSMGSTTITVQGAVSCTSHPLVGVWVKSSGGGSRFAVWSTSSSNGYDGTFSTTISTALPTTLQLQVGCGGSSSTWWSNNWTPGVSISGSVTLEASCNEGTIQPPKGSNSRCAFTTTSGESAAISWAEGQMANNPSGYYLQCLKFVFDAYEVSSNKQINLHAMISPQPPSWPNTYPVQIWGHFNHGVTGTDANPPPGAIVFWKASNGSVKGSHAALSIGGGYVITTAYNGNPDIHKASMSQFPGAVELGWWLPA